MAAYRTLKTLLHGGSVYRRGHVFTGDSGISQNDIDEGRVEIINDAEAEAQTSSKPMFNAKKRGRGNPAEV